MPNDASVLPRSMSLIVAIDAQKGFCDPAGSLALAFGASEIVPIRERLHRLDRQLADFGSTDHVWLVRSEYRRGQFTNGDASHPLAELCVPGTGIDCDWSLSPRAVAGKRIFTKTTHSAVECLPFREQVLKAVVAGIEAIYVIGFVTPHCVKATAIDLRKLVPASVAVGIVEGLCGSRTTHLAQNGRDSVHAMAIREMASAGVAITPGTALPRSSRRSEGGCPRG